MPSSNEHFVIASEKEFIASIYINKVGNSTMYGIYFRLKVYFSFVFG